MNERDEITCQGTDEGRRAEPLRPYAKRGIWAAGLLLIVAGAVSLYLYSVHAKAAPLTVVGGNPVSVGEWPCGKNIATGITLKNDSGLDVVLDHMVVY